MSRKINVKDLVESFAQTKQFQKSKTIREFLDEKKIIYDELLLEEIIEVLVNIYLQSFRNLEI